MPLPSHSDTSLLPTQAVRALPHRGTFEISLTPRTTPCRRPINVTRLPVHGSPPPLHFPRRRSSSSFHLPFFFSRQIRFAHRPYVQTERYRILYLDQGMTLEPTATPHIFPKQSGRIVLRAGAFTLRGTSQTHRHPPVLGLAVFLVPLCSPRSLRVRTQVSVFAWTASPPAQTLARIGDEGLSTPTFSGRLLLRTLFWWYLWQRSPRLPGANCDSVSFPSLFLRDQSSAIRPPMAEDVRSSSPSSSSYFAELPSPSPGRGGQRSARSQCGVNSSDYTPYRPHRIYGFPQFVGKFVTFEVPRSIGPGFALRDHSPVFAPHV